MGESESIDMPPSPLRLLLLQYSNPWNRFSPGGIGLVNHAVLAQLVEAGYQVEVLTGCLGRGIARKSEDGIEYRTAGDCRSRILDRLFFSRAASMAALGGFDLVVIPWDRYAPVRLSSGKTPVLLELHADYSSIPSKIGSLEFLADWLLHRALRKARYLAAVSRAIHDKACLAGRGFRLSKVMPNGIPPEYFGGEPKTSAGDYILFVGRLDIDTKGLDTLLDAYRLAGVDNPLHIMGEGPDRELLRCMINERGLEGRVRLLGWLNGKQKIAAMARAGFLVMPSRSEGFPLVALEAMAQGLPLIASNVGGLREVVEDQKSGILCEAESVESFASAIRLLATEREVCVRMAAGARERADCFTLEKAVAARVEIYGAVVADAR